LNHWLPLFLLVTAFFLLVLIIIWCLIYFSKIRSIFITILNFVVLLVIRLIYVNNMGIQKLSLCSLKKYIILSLFFFLKLSFVFKLTFLFLYPKNPHLIFHYYIHHLFLWPNNITLPVFTFFCKSFCFSFLAALAVRKFNKILKKSKKIHIILY
jgi:hypothetical protein